MEGSAERAGRWAIARRTMPSRVLELSSLPLEELLRACVDKAESDCWEELIRRTHPVIAATVLRVARRFGETSPALIADLVQDVYVRIAENRCRVLREFHAENPEAIFSLLKVVAFNLTQDHFRAVTAQMRGPERYAEPLDSPRGSAVAAPDGAEAIERQVLLREIDDLLACSRTERRIFWLYYRQGLTASAISALPGIGLTQKGVESTIHRLTGRLREWLASKNVNPESKGKASGSAL